MRIALFGGSFDPPHRGHIAIARAAARAFGLDLILLAPTGVQPLKVGREATSFLDRMALTVAAMDDAFLDGYFEASVGLDMLDPDRPDRAPQFSVTNMDKPREDGRPNYTVDLLSSLRRQHPADELFNLVGADSFLSLPQWRSPHRLLELAEWIVVSRPGYSVSHEDLTPLGLGRELLGRIHFLRGVEEDISSSAVRERLRLGDPCTDMLSPMVAGCIRERGLYR